MKKIKYFLNKWDGLWSVPVAFFLFWLVGELLTHFFGLAAGTWDLGFIQPLFLAIVIVIGATNAGVMGLRFTLKGLHDYLYGKRMGSHIVKSAKSDWGNLTPTVKIVSSLICLLYFITAILIVYLHLT